MKKPIAAMMILLLSSQVAMGQTFDNKAQSNSQSGVYLGGSNTDVQGSVAGAYAPSLPPTANCMGTAGVGGQDSILGFSLGGSYLQEWCAVMEEAKALEALFGTRAAIHHLCANNKRMRKTLVEMGICVIKDSK